MKWHTYSMLLPETITSQIARRAVEIAQQLAPKDTGSGAAAMSPVSGPGQVGMNVPAHMKIQNYGSAPHIMRELAGKTIPIRTPSGEVVFRRATTENIGRNKIVSRNEKGQIVATKITWRNPGIKGQHFVEQGIQQAVKEWASTTTGSSIIRMLDETDLKFLMDAVRGTR